MISSSPRTFTAVDSSPIVVSGSSTFLAMARISLPRTRRRAAFHDRSAAAFCARKAADNSGSPSSRTRHLRSVLSSTSARLAAARSPDNAASIRVRIASCLSNSGLAIATRAADAGRCSPRLRGDPIGVGPSTSNFCQPWEAFANFGVVFDDARPSPVCVVARRRLLG